jgi:predicted transcriptional regulator
MKWSFKLLEVAGIGIFVLQRDVVKALAEGRAGARVADVVCNRSPTVEADQPLDRAVDQMQAAGCSALLVESDGELVGMLTSEHLGDWMMLHSARSQSPPDAPAQNASTR